MIDLEAKQAWALGEWTVDPHANELVHRSGNRVRLEARAMRVLELLHAHTGTVVTTEEILSEVWGRKVVSPHSVATVISELRKALGDDSRESRYIETIPKRGYRLATPDQPPAEDAPRRFRPMTVVLGAAAVLIGVAVIWIGRTVSQDATASRAVESTATAKYLQARQLWGRREHDATLQARDLLGQVIQENPEFAAAHAALADIYAHKTGDELGLPELETFREAQRHLDRAQTLDPNIAESYVTQALLDFFRDHQPRKALASVDVALSKDAQFAYAWQTRAMLMSAVGEHAKSLEAIARARELDPVSTSIGWDEVWFLYLAGESERALAAFDRESRNSEPVYLYGALIEQSRANTRAAMKFWLQRLRVREAAIADPRAIEVLATEGSTVDAYRELLRQANAVDGYQESTVVLAIWEYLAGNAAAARDALASTTPDRRSWLSLWVQEMPVFAPLRANENS